MLLAIAIYCSNDVNKPYIFKAAVKKTSFLSYDPLPALEKTSLTDALEKGMEANKIYHYTDNNEHHYLRHEANDHIRVMVSARKLTRNEQLYLFHNSKSVPLDKIIQQPDLYATKNASRAKIDAVQAKLDETKGILLQTIDRVVERGEKLEALEEKAFELKLTSEGFNEETRKLNRCCSYW